MANEFKNKNEFKEEFQRRIIERYGRSLEQAHITEKYMILGEMVRDYASIHWNASKNVVAEKQEKQMYYFSMEFLMGRLLTNNLMNLGIYEIAKEGLAELGQDINELEDLESDAGLGNGGLGRLAACFLDSLASLNLAGHGNCIRYEYGLFKQKIVNNEQVEVPDQWLSLGNVWEVRKPKHAVNVNFGGHVDMWMGEDGKAIVNHVPSLIVRAVPYDMPIVGQNTNLTNTLRLWSAEVADDACDASSLNEYVNEVREICRNVYPDDSTEHGKILRLKQQYFFVAAGLNNIIESHMSTYHTLDNFSEKVAIQLNDTHPVLCIPELMRILMDDYKYDWDQAWDITKNTMAYTNHTVLSEALEKWPIQYVQDLLPRVFMIIEEIDRRFKYEVSHDMGRSDLMNECCVLKDGQVHMANLAIIGSHSVNGVAALHTKILKEDVMKNFHDIYPNKFNNKTNGITHRRWLLYSNPQLSNLLEKTIGPDFKANPERLQDLMKYVDDKDLQKEFMDVKMERKKILAAYIKETLHIDIDVNSIFDVQAKRLHAYKRQLLNVMNIIDLYFRMKQDPSFRIYPRTFIFAAKAAPSYTFAKEVIKLIHYVADKVNNDSDVSPYMKVVFIPNYGVSIAEILMNAADVSEQISTAGKEASGTGNMKFMMNGAITLGTMDGANVEIVEKVGYDHAEIFGLRADDVALVKHENTYDVWRKYNENANIQKVVNSFVDSTFSNDPKDFKQIYNELMFKNDEYLLLADFEAYSHAQKNIEERYRNKEEWAKTCLINIAQSGYFSSDRTIKQYADEIWNIEPVNMK
ncbi:glycogen/starch/alpha-glucan phosphorylase [[Clostridium] innocuum]|uniref:glycogen/starch/alpha-glucan phosphorylase n=1 Tax=Clostridium innocuum TaxID=1522 RepID=UPI003A4D8FA7